eukprot:1706836-Pyramimonas_sp.AAC.2
MGPGEPRLGGLGHGSFFLDVARSRSDARPDFRSPGGGDPPAGGPGKEAAQRQGRVLLSAA